MKNIYITLLFFFICISIGHSQWHSLYHDAHYEVYAEHSGIKLGMHYEFQDEVIQGPANQTSFGTLFRFIPNPDMPGYYWIAFERSPFVGNNANNVYLEAQVQSRPYVLKGVREKKNESSQMFKLINLRSDLHTYPFQIGSKITEDMGSMEYLDVEASGGNGAKVVLYPHTGNTNQSFSIRKRGGKGPGADMRTKDGCFSIASASFEGGTVYSLQKMGQIPLPLDYGNDAGIRANFPTMLSVSVRELRDNLSKEVITIQYDRSCSSKREFFLNGRKISQIYKGADVGQTLLEESIYLEDYHHELLESERKFHLLAVRFTVGVNQTVGYFPFYISHKRKVSEVKGTTVTPEIPYMILHAPPGDQSYSWVSKEQQICHGMDFSVQKDFGFEVYGSARMGAKGSLGIIAETEYEAYAEVSASMTMSMSTTSSGGNEVCFNTTETFSTTPDNGLVGSEGDVFIGFAMSVDYGTSNYLERSLEDPGNPVEKADLVMAASTDPSKTKQFMYTESHIRDVKMVKLQEFIDDPTTPGALVEDYKDQLKVWERILQINSGIKVAPGASVENNLIFSSFTAKSQESSVSTTTSRAFEFSMEIDQQVGLEIGAYVGGTGAMGGFKMNMRSEIGSSVSNSTTHSNTIGYHLEDDDQGDEFDIEVLTDPVFGTPLFRVNQNGTATSCPYEGGYQREQPRLEVGLTRGGNYGISARATDIPQNQAALFYLNVINESDEARSYDLRLEPNSLKNGEKITIGGQPLIANGSVITYSPAANGSIDDIQLSFEAGPDKTITEYGPIPLILYSECQPEIESIIYLEVQFSNSTSTSNQQDERLKFDIYPNPSSGITFIEFHQPDIDKVIEIRNVQGQLVHQKVLSGNREKMDEDFSFLSDGVYQVRIIDDNGQFFRRWVKN